MAVFQSSEEEYFEPREIVRVFSMGIRAQCEDNLESGTEIKRVLVSKLNHDESQQERRIQQINDYLSSTKPEELVKLAQQRHTLEQAMQEFKARVQKAHPQDADVELRNIKSWEDVASTVESMMCRLKEKQETSKFRRATKHLRTFCNTVNAHSTALKMLPTNNDYVSVFYGALATVLQASEGYTKVLEALPQALIEINDAVSAIEKRLWLFENDTMKCYAWRMYSQIFSFLGEVIRWYTKRSIQRLIGSFNEHLLEFFDDQVGEIRKLSRLIHDEAVLRAQADSQISRLYLEGINEKFDRFMTELRDRDLTQRGILDRRYEDFHAALEGKRRSELWNKDVLEQALLDTWTRIKERETGYAVTEILEGDVRRRALAPNSPESVQRASHDGSSSPSGASISGSIIANNPDGSDGLKDTRDAMLIRSAGLEDYFDRAKTLIPQTSADGGLFANSSIAGRIKSWIMATESQILYTAGTDPFGEDRQTSNAASYYAHAARKAGIPVCSYSCSLEGMDPPPYRTRETIELVAMVYSLIRQLIELLPPTAPMNTAWHDDRWTELEGTLDTFPQALQILEALLHSTGQAIIVIIIDRIDLLDDLSYRSSEKWLKCLVELLLCQTSTEQGTILKIWFVSSGSSSVLFEALDVNQIAISSPPRRKAGRAIFDDELIVL